MSEDLLLSDAAWIAGTVRSGEVSARAVAEAALDRISNLDPTYNSFTEVISEQALIDADLVDNVVRNGGDPGPLAGVPFAVKNLFDIAGVTTLAGSKMYRENPPATKDATAVSRLRQAGGVLIGALNMSEFAYGYTNENTHYGPARNPHDGARVSGGSSGGSGAAVAGGLVPLSLGSDTNGSIRLPAALCGVFGFKPTYGALSRAGTALFASSFDHIGPFARSVQDIATAYDTIRGPDPTDPVCHGGSASPLLETLDRGIDGLRIAVADDYFRENGTTAAFAAVEKVADALGANQTVTIPEARRARGAAFVITHCEGAVQHRDDLRDHLDEFDPTTRPGFMTGSLLPGNWYVRAQKFRSWYRKQVLTLFEDFDLILAPATPFSATKIGQKSMTLDGQDVPVMANLGIYAQPLSFIGLPILCAPVHGIGAMPHGVQIIAAPNNDALALRAGAYLEASGVCSAPVAAA
ncbi:MAG: AtzE family amidohydrolase [Alphaproteobacteria bacterium]|nr:AtzE family amidohydrolase [Alphaproteobacteria bacterium]